MNNYNRDNTYQGEISIHSQKLLVKKMEIWLDGLNSYNHQIINEIGGRYRKFVFLTLTLPSVQFHTDEVIKAKILKPFLRKLRTSFGCDNYIWKAESQENGNIHFHLVLDVYLDKVVVMSLWNKCLNVLGYIDSFEKRFNHRNPPTTRIETVNDKKGLFMYFSKYIVKDESYRQINGAVWKASKSVLSLQFFEFVSDSFVDIRIDHLAEIEEVNIYSKERYSVIDLKKTKIEQVIGRSNFKDYQIYLNLLMHFLFYSKPVDNFRDYCFLFSIKDIQDLDRLPIICKKTYPVPIQLDLFEAIGIIKPKDFKLFTR